MALNLFGKQDPPDKVVRIEGLDEFRKALRKLDNQDGLQALKDTNIAIAEMIVAKTKPRMATRSKRSADSLRAAKSSNGAAVYGGGAKAPMFGGVEFGAYQNQRRLIKHPYKGKGRTAKRGRSTIVRDGENIAKIKRKVESNYVTSTGKTVSSREGGSQVRVKNVRVGWNFFDKWTGNGENAGYFLYDSVRSSSEDIMEMYRKAMLEIAHDAFPKGSE